MFIKYVSNSWSANACVVVCKTYKPVSLSNASAESSSPSYQVSLHRTHPLGHPRWHVSSNPTPITCGCGHRVGLWDYRPPSPTLWYCHQVLNWMCQPRGWFLVTYVFASNSGEAGTCSLQWRHGNQPIPWAFSAFWTSNNVASLSNQFPELPSSWCVPS